MSPAPRSLPIRFHLNERLVELRELPATTTLLRYLRDAEPSRAPHQGCPDGGCGTYTVIISERPHADEPRATFRAADASLLLLPMLHGRWVWTVESLRGQGDPCATCAPDHVMSLFEARYRQDTQEVDVRVEELSLEYSAAGQTWFQPRTLDELWAARAALPGAVLVAGGTGIALEVTRRHRSFSALIGLGAIEELRAVTRHQDGWELGAGITLTRLLEVLGPTQPGFEKMLRAMASGQVREQATLGGNLCNTSPIGDLAPLFIALDATMILAGPRGQRTVPLKELFSSDRDQALARDEILLALRWQDPPEGALLTSARVPRRHELDTSALSAAMLLDRDPEGRVCAIRVAFGGVAAVPQRAPRVEQALMGRPWTRPELEQAADQLPLDLQPITDPRGSARFRMMLAREMLLGFL